MALPFSFSCDVPHSRLSKTWEKIHGAKVVEIYELKGKKSEHYIAYYTVGNYVLKQPIKRMSYSQKWVCKSFSKKWKTFSEAYQRGLFRYGTWLLSVFYSFTSTKLNEFIESKWLLVTEVYTSSSGLSIS